MRAVKIIAATFLVGAATPAFADAGSDLKNVVNDYWDSILLESPLTASSLGKPADPGIGDYSIEGKDRVARDADRFLTRLKAIDVAKLNTAESVEYGILRRQLEEIIEGNRYPQRVINFTNRSGWHQSLAEMTNYLPLKTKADFESYNARLKKYPVANDQSIAVADLAIKGKYTLPCVSLNGYEKSISGLIVADATKSRFYEPYTKTKPDMISDADWRALSGDAAATVQNIITPALNKHLNWYMKNYKPACAKEPGISAQKGGMDYYNYRIRQETTTTLTADQIHNIGLSEVARIRADMVDVAKKAGYPSREAFIEHLRTDPQYYPKTPEELMENVARITKTIDGKMPGLFKRLPRLPYGIKEIPSEIAEGTTTAYYSSGSPAIGVAGFYYVNTSKLNQRPFWEMPVLSVHEAVPGHHHQIALQQELELSEFRKNGAFFTAFVEGWALYSERLGIEMGLYDTPAKDMGRLSFEMWRACRLVVDTGIHAKGWSKEQAIAYMRDNTALSDANIEAEVNRYISWPGQALAYKIGELKIRELRTLATKELGAKFDLAAFHDAVLGQGSLPLDVLDTQVKAWIAAEKAKP